MAMKRLIVVSTCLLTLAGGSSVAASEIGQEIADQVSLESYRHYEEDLLYTHLGDNRDGVNGPQHAAARDNIVATFQSLGLDVELHPFASYGEVHYNVVATQTGVSYPDSYYLISGHYDSVHNPGADDDASGVAAVMEIARVFSQYTTHYTIKYVAFDLEEYGLIGSTAYVNDHVEDDVRGMISMDMIAWDVGSFATDLRSRPGSQPLKQIVRNAILEYGEGLGVQILDIGAGGSDHSPFEDVGFQACLMIERNYSSNPCYHQPCDAIETPDYFSYDLALAHVRSIAGFLADQAVAQPLDCDGNGIMDLCDLDCGEPGGMCDVPGCGLATDCNGNLRLDVCEPQDDCNENGIQDICDVAAGASEDCQPNGIPDECEIDENSSAPGGPFFCTQDCDPDCNNNGIPDACDIAAGVSEDCTGNGIPDECEPDCNANGVADSCDILTGTSIDCDGDWQPDECQDTTADCNGNGAWDACDIYDLVSGDCNENGVPDECDLASGTSPDCNGNGNPDECDYGGEIFYEQLPDGLDVVIADSDCDVPNAPPEVSAAENFVAHKNLWIGQIVLWGTYYPNDSPSGGNDFTVIFHEDDAGVPGTVVLGYAHVPTQRALTGDLVLGALDEWRFTLTFSEPVHLPPGAYWVEIYNRTAGIEGNTFIWETGALDEETGGLGFAQAIETPGELWYFAANLNLAIQFITAGETECNGNGVPDSCDIADGTSTDWDGNGLPDDCDADCNDNGVPDVCEVPGGCAVGDCASAPTCGASTDCNANGVPDDCEGDVCPPAPSPMAWEQNPAPVVDAPGLAAMTAVEATDPSGVEYLFACAAGNCHSSVWQASRDYVDAGLSANAPYSYRVRARDLSPLHNETAPSPAVQMITSIQKPTTVAFGTVTESSIQVTVPGTFSNLALYQSGLYVEVTLNGAPTGGGDANAWRKSQTFNVTGLAPATTYRFRVKARNMVAFETTYSEPFDQATTGGDPCQVCGDLDNDQDVDERDFALFAEAFGRDADHPSYNVCADFDADGRITLADYQVWLMCYWEYDGRAPGGDAPARPDAQMRRAAPSAPARPDAQMHRAAANARPASRGSAPR